jgi:hypothetical protein
MSTEAASSGAFDLQLELTRLLWICAALLAVVLYLSRAVR